MCRTVVLDEASCDVKSIRSNFWLARAPILSIGSVRRQLVADRRSRRLGHFRTVASSIHPSSLLEYLMFRYLTLFVFYCIHRMMRLNMSCVAGVDCHRSILCSTCTKVPSPA